MSIVRRAHVERERADALNRVDDEVHAALATQRAERLEIDARAGRELHPRHVTRAHALVLELARETLGVEHALVDTRSRRYSTPRRSASAIHG